MSAVTAASDDEPKAMKLATKLAAMQSLDFDDVFLKSAAELRRQHAEIESLKQQLAQWVQGRYVAVDRGTLNMVINALRRDEANGMRSRGEMAELLSAVPAQQASAFTVPAWAILQEAFDHGQFADDFDKPLAKPLRKAIRELLSAAPAQPEQPIDTDGVFPEWKPGNYEFKRWCTSYFGADADEAHLAIAVLNLPRKPSVSMLADEFELRRLLAEERETTRQLSRELAKYVDGPSFTGEPVAVGQNTAEAGNPAPWPLEMDKPAAQDEPMFWVRLRGDGLYEGPVHHKQIERVRQQSGAWTPPYTRPQPASPFAIPALNHVARRKLQDLLADGHQVAGVMIERQNADGTVTRGAVGAGGLVIWWPPQSDPHGKAVAA